MARFQDYGCIRFTFEIANRFVGIPVREEQTCVGGSSNLKSTNECDAVAPILQKSVIKLPVFLGIFTLAVDAVPMSFIDLANTVGTTIFLPQLGQLKSFHGVQSVIRTTSLHISRK